MFYVIFKLIYIIYYNNIIFICNIIYINYIKIIYIPYILIL